MDLVDGSSHFQDKLTDQVPSLLTVILDTNPLAWALLEKVLPLSTAVANLLVFINAHLASSYTNRALLSSTTEASLSSSSPSSPAISTATSTHVAGALTLALSYINRLSIQYTDSVMGPDQTMLQASAPNNNGGGGGGTNTDSRQLQSRILLVSVSPSTDLANQYIPIMNAVFACQRLNIPIDILQIRLPGKAEAGGKPTVFLQQASDATSGIFITFMLPSASSFNGKSNSSSSESIKTAASQSLLTYLLTAFVTSPSTRELLTPPTAINVDFRAACFCHRRVIDLGYVCSICLSIFCEVPPEGVCLTCGNKLQIPEGYGKRPVVVAKKKKKKRQTATSAATPTALDTPHNSR
ncbi:hypothetical protein DV735_g1520, partial [Chaetothyriales sp. CBS 134920]